MNKVELTKKEKIEISIEKLKNKKSKVFFIITNNGTPTASIYEIYRHATILKNMGYEIHMLTDTSDFVIPEWIEKELTDFKHESVDSVKLSVSPEDMMIIPDTFSNVMEQTKNLPCLRVGLLQSIDYMMNALTPAVDWNTFGITKIIATNNNLAKLVEDYFTGKFDIKIINPSIPDYFFIKNEFKKPVISLVGRNANEISKIVKLFYAKYPHYRWITFDTMYTDSVPPQPLDRKGFAKRLSENFIGVWIDRIASFGTFPLECMASGTIPIAMNPDITPEYILSDDNNTTINEYAGFWTDNIYDIPILIGSIITKYLDDLFEDEFYSKMSKIAEKYKYSDGVINVENVYSQILEERQTILENALKNLIAAEENNNIKTKTEENE